ncbi:mechanosensitive ion channel [Novosphingobium sp. AAP83]|uniref:mechanosensitive ion channel n=1 Tax=Novosphingobium sp. AAP83 TaxID=1523425 RepID=UPI0006B9CCA2|nr:mechanosensitive ion channel [Novosphingobium sp. AAP83]
MGTYQFDATLAASLVQKVLAVALILAVTWVLAKAAKWSFAKLVDKVPLFQKAAASGESVGASLGRIVSLFIWLFGLVAILQALNLNSVIGPVQGLINSFVSFVPKILGAALIFFVGGTIAKIVRDIVATTLLTINFDKWANLGGAEAVTGNATISKTLSTIVFVLIIVPVGIAALDVLNIPSITVPAKSMLQLILGAVPLIIGASLLLGLGYVIARWVGKMIEEVLPGLGLDRSVTAMGIMPEGKSISGILATIVQIAIMLFMAIAATRMLGFPELTRIVETILEQGANVTFGAVLIGAGVILARVLKGLIATAAGDGIAPALVNWLTIGLFVFIGLKQMNIGGQIVDYAFGAIAAGSAVAFALAVGLGSRDAVARKMNDLVK